MSAQCVRVFAATLAPVALAVAAVLSLGVATVQNESMAPTLHGGDIVVFDRWSAAARGDIVLVRDREGWSGRDDAVLVKRVIGVAGDVVVCCDSATGSLLVNGRLGDEPYVDLDRAGGNVPFRVAVPEGTVWVMGDNRAASADSRLSVSTDSRGGIPLVDVRGVVRAWWGR